MMKLHNNKRKTPRYNANLIIKYGKPYNTVRSISRTENISLGGTFFYSLTHLPIGCELRCTLLRLRTRSEMKLQARVIRSEELPGKIITTYGIGIEFIKLSFTEQKKLLQLIK